MTITQANYQPFVGGESQYRTNVVDKLGVPDVIGADATAYMQAAFDRQEPLLFPPGIYRYTDQLYFDDGQDIEFAPGAVWYQDFSKNPGALGAGVRNRDFATRLTSIRLFGPGEIRAFNNTTHTGDLVHLYGNDFRMSDLNFTKVGTGRELVLAGDYIRTQWLRFYGTDGTAGSAGFRYIGGEGFRGFGLEIDSGDDGLQFVPSSSLTDPLNNIDIIDGWYIGCTSRSSAGKCMTAGLTSGSAAGTQDMTASIIASGWSECGGYGKGFGIRANNENSSGSVEVTAHNCIVDQINSDCITGEIIANSNGPVGGSIGPVILKITGGTRIRHPNTATIKVAGNSTVYTDDTFYAERSTNRPGDPVIDVRGILVMEGGVLDGKDSTTGDVIAIRTDVWRPTNPGKSIIAPARIQGIGDGRYGVTVANDIGSTIRDTEFVKTAGATTARAVSIAATSTGTKVRDTDLTPLAIADPITDAGTGSQLYNNLGGTDTSIGSVQFAYAPTDAAPVNNSTVLVTSAVLVATLLPNAIYAFEAVVSYDCSTVSDFKVNWSTPAGCTGYWSNDGPPTTQAAGAANSTQVKRVLTALGTGDAVGGANVGVLLVNKPSGFVITGANGGTFAMQYAQNGADPTDLTLRAGRYLKVTRVA